MVGADFLGPEDQQESDDEQDSRGRDGALHLCSDHILLLLRLT
jgi:hypothetical protein